MTPNYLYFEATISEESSVFFGISHRKVIQIKSDALLSYFNFINNIYRQIFISRMHGKSGNIFPNIITAYTILNLNPAREIPASHSAIPIALESWSPACRISLPCKEGQSPVRQP